MKSDILQQLLRVLNFVLDQGPNLFKDFVQILAFFLGLSDLLVEYFLAISKQADQLFVLRLELLNLLQGCLGRRH